MRRSWMSLGLLLLSGCAGARWFQDRPHVGSPVDQQETTSGPTGRGGELARPSPPAASSDSQPALVNEAPASSHDDSAWQQTLAQLRERRDLDPHTQAKLLADMEQVAPLHRPMMARMLAAVLAPASAGAASETFASSPRSGANDSPPPREFSPTRAALAVAPEISRPLVQPRSDSEFLALAERYAAAAAPVAPAPTTEPATTSWPAAPTSPSAATQITTAAANATPPLATPANPAAPQAEPVDWKKELQASIQALQHEIQKLPEKDAARARLEISLRLLQLTAGEKDAAVKGMDRLDPWQRDYWKHQLHALAVGLDEGGTPVANRRAALALRELREATAQLAQGSTLDVRNLAFCTRVDSFGRYAEFAKSEFQPNQELLLYAEVENVAVTQSPSGFESSLQGSYQILDSAGHRVADVTFPVETDLCRNQRRDYFIPFRLYLPKKIEPGRYTLQLTVEDIKGKKFGQGSLDFSITSEPASPPR